MRLNGAMAMVGAIAATAASWLVRITDSQISPIMPRLLACELVARYTGLQVGLSGTARTAAGGPVASFVGCILKSE